MVGSSNSDIVSVESYRLVDRVSYSLLERNLAPEAKRNSSRNESRTEAGYSNPEDAESNGSVNYSSNAELQSPDRPIVLVDHNIGSSVADADPNSARKLPDPNSGHIGGA